MLKKFIIIVISLISVVSIAALLLIQSSNERISASEQNGLAVPATDPGTFTGELMKKIEQSPKLKAMYELGKASNIDVEFYGRVLDQHGEPVSGAEVSVTLLKWRILDAGGEAHKFTTDAAGNFTITGISGEMLTIRNIEKDGYDFQGAESFRGAPHYEGDTESKLWGGTSQGKPWVIKVWKKGEAEPLVYTDTTISFPQSGKTYSIDLVKPEKTGNRSKGDINVTLTRSPEEVRADLLLPWSVKIEAIGGGLIETNDKVMNQAPEFGYQPVWQLSYDGTEGNNYLEIVTKKFYLKSRGGQVYGRLEFEFLPYYNDGSLIVGKWWLNPNGSRNLQYDSSKRINTNCKICG